MDTITKTLNELMNAKKAGKTVCTVTPVSSLLLEVLNLMKSQGYIDFKVEKDKFQKVVVTIKSLNECRAIRPRFHFQKAELEKYLRRYLPSRDLGIVIVSTDHGVTTHSEAMKNGLGGVLLAYSF